MATEKNTISSLMIPPAPTLSLDTDSGVFGDDVTNFGIILVGGLVPGATWQYSADGGSTWINGVDIFIDQPAVDGDYVYQVRQIDTSGAVSAPVGLSFTLDTFADAPIIRLERDTGVSGDNITTNGTVRVVGLEPGGLWQYRESNGNWVTGTGDRFTLTGAGMKSVEVRVSDSAGNVSASTAIAFELRNIPAPTLSLAVDSNIDGDLITNDGTIAVAGLIPGATWHYSLDGGASWIQGTGTNIALTGDGLQHIVVRQTDPLGQSSDPSTVFSFVLDTLIATPTLALVIDTAIGTDGITTNGTVHVTGLEAGADWQYSADGGATWLAGSGTSFGVTGEGVKDVLVRQLDVAGNLAHSTHLNFILTDDTVPVQLVSIDVINDDVGSRQGNMSSGDSTDDDHFDMAGSLSAPLMPGYQVAIYNASAFLGFATVTGTQWSFNPGVLPLGNHSFSVHVVNLGNGLSGADSSPFDVNIVGSISLEVSDFAGADIGMIADGAITDDATPALSGSISAPLAPGEQVGVYDGSTLLGYATLNPARTGWSFVTAVLAAGDHVLTVKVENAAGTELLASSPHTITVVPQVAATLAITEVSDNILNGGFVGILADGQSTDDNRLFMKGTFTGSINVGDSVIIYDGATRLGVATVNRSTGEWSYTTPTLVGDGRHTLSARVENANSGLIGTASDAFDINLVSITLTRVIDNGGSVIGDVSAGGTTDDRAPELQGNLSATLAVGERVAIYDGLTRLGYATVNGTTWSYTQSYLSPLSPGLHTLQAKIENATQEVLVASNPHPITVDPQAAATLHIMEVADNILNGGFVGQLTDGQSTDDARLFMSGTFTGTLNVGDSVVIYDGATRLGNASVNRSLGAWSFTTPTLVGDGQHALTARVENINSGLIGSFTDAFDVNLVNIAISRVVDSVGSILGDVILGGTTDDRTPGLLGTLSATLAAGERVAIYDGLFRLGYATVSGTSWSYEHNPLSPLLSGLHILQAKIENASGDTLIASAAHDITISIPLLPFQASVDAFSEEASSTQDGLLAGLSLTTAAPVDMTTLLATHLVATNVPEVNLNNLAEYGFVMTGEPQWLPIEPSDLQAWEGDRDVTRAATQPAANEVYVAYGDLGGVALPTIEQHVV